MEPAKDAVIAATSQRQSHTRRRQLSASAGRDNSVTSSVGQDCHRRSKLSGAICETMRSFRDHLGRSSSSMRLPHDRRGGDITCHHLAGFHCSMREFAVVFRGCRGGRSASPRLSFTLSLSLVQLRWHVSPRLSRSCSIPPTLWRVNRKATRFSTTP